MLQTEFEITHIEILKDASLLHRVCDYMLLLGVGGLHLCCLGHFLGFIIVSNASIRSCKAA